MTHLCVNIKVPIDTKTTDASGSILILNLLFSRSLSELYLHFLFSFCGFFAFKRTLHGQSFKSDDSVLSHVSFRDSIPLECGPAGRAEP